MKKIWNYEILRIDGDTFTTRDIAVAFVIMFAALLVIGVVGYCETLKQ